MSSSARKTPKMRTTTAAVAVAVAIALTVYGATSTSGSSPDSQAAARGALGPAAGGADLVAGGPRPAPIVHLPSGWHSGARVPLVIALHASGGTPAGFEATSGWDR